MKIEIFSIFKSLKIYLLIAIQNILREKIKFSYNRFSNRQKTHKNKNILKFDNHSDEYIVSPSKKITHF